MVELVVINKSNMHLMNVANLIEAFVDKTKTKTKEEHLIGSIASGESILLLLTEDDDYAGFFVLSEIINRQDKKEIMVWMGYGIKPLSNDAIETAMDKIKDIAKCINAERIFFRTQRKGWAKRGMRYGFQEAEKTYEIKVDYASAE
jgi:hypothetical protein